MTNKEIVQVFFSSLWTDPERARALAAPDVTWITTRSMPIPGNEATIHHVGWKAVLNVANSGKDHDVGYRTETMSKPYQLFLEAEEITSSTSSRCSARRRRAATTSTTTCSSSS